MLKGRPCARWTTSRVKPATWCLLSSLRTAMLRSCDVCDVWHSATRFPTGRWSHHNVFLEKNMMGSWYDIERYWQILKVKWNGMTITKPGPLTMAHVTHDTVRRSLQVFLFEDPSQLMSGSKHTSCCETYHIPHCQNGIGYIRYILILSY